MSKAEERANETYPLRDAEHVYDEERVIEARGYFVEGYNRAEKDLALTWNDMMVIHKCCKDAMNKHLYEWNTPEGQQKIYEDVLKRFKDLKK